MTKAAESDFIQGADELMKRLQIGPSAFRTLIEAGLPGRYHNNRWYFHFSNVNRWLEVWTAVSVGQVLEEEQLNGQHK